MYNISDTFLYTKQINPNYSIFIHKYLIASGCSIADSFEKYKPLLVNTSQKTFRVVVLTVSRLSDLCYIDNIIYIQYNTWNFYDTIIILLDDSIGIISKCSIRQKIGRELFIYIITSQFFGFKAKILLFHFSFNVIFFSIFYTHTKKQYISRQQNKQKKAKSFFGT